MAQRPHPLPIQADKRVSQVSQISDFSVNSNGSDARRHKAHIGPWRLGRTLGRGSSGRVRLAKHATSNKLAAVKVIPKISPSTVRTGSKGKGTDKVGGLPYSIEREVVIMKLIEHPNIMKLYDVWENKGELYLVLEYIEGGELFDYLVQRGRLEEPEAVDYISQILDAVDYCHRFNICHRDLKPENLLLDNNKKIKVADFGMAALEPSGQMLKTSCGSPHYASPEIIAGKTYHGGPSDIWSCGIILFALLTGHLPFDDENIHTLLLKVKTGHFVMPPHLGVEAKDLIWRMLELDPIKRIKMPEILAHPLLQKYARQRINKMARTPTVEEIAQPVQSASEIDREILKNLQTLWRGTPKDHIVQKLLEPGANTEKTFYCLLLKYRVDRLGHYPEETRLPHSQSRKSIQSKKSGTSRRGHAKTASRGSRISTTSSHRRGVSFGASKKKKELAPAIPLDRPITFGTPKRMPPISPEGQQAVDESTRHVSAEFSEFLDVAFNSKKPVSIYEDKQSKPLPSIPARPASAEPVLSRTDTHKSRAHKSAEIAAPLARIFEEERFADAEEENFDEATVHKAHLKIRSAKTMSYPTSRQRAVLGEINPNTGSQRPWPLQNTEKPRITSMIVPPTQLQEPQTRRFVSDPIPSDRPNWFKRTFSLTKPIPSSLAARRQAPPPPSIQIFPHPSTFSTPKQSFFSRLLGIKPLPIVINTSTQARVNYRCCVDKLSSFYDHGIRIQADKKRKIIMAKVLRNQIGLKRVNVKIEFIESRVVVSMLRGNIRSFERVAREIEILL